MWEGSQLHRTSLSNDANSSARVTSVIIVAAAVLITLYVWGTIERHPRTDDAAARANVVGIVPRVRGQIVKLAVQDNQLVKEGDLLFEIDPDDYELALEKAKSALAPWTSRLRSDVRRMRN